MWIQIHLIPNHGELDGHGKCTIFWVTVYLFELAFDTVMVEYIMHSGILNYTKLAFNSLKVIKNDTANQTGDDRPLNPSRITAGGFVKGRRPVGR